MIAPLVHSIVSGLTAAVSIWYAYKSRKAAKQADATAVRVEFHADRSCGHAQDAEHDANRSEECMAVASQHAARADQQSQASQTWSKASELHAEASRKHRDQAALHHAKAEGFAKDADGNAECAEQFMNHAALHAGDAENHAKIVAAHTEDVKQTAKIHQIRVQASVRCAKCGARAAKYSITPEGVTVCASCDAVAYKKSQG